MSLETWEAVKPAGPGLVYPVRNHESEDRVRLHGLLSTARVIAGRFSGGLGRFAIDDVSMHLFHYPDLCN
jgi:hypothetical protein